MCMLIVLSTACSQQDPTQSAGISSTEHDAGVETPDARRNLSFEKLTVDQQVSGALENLAGRLDLNRDAIQVFRASSVTWGSGAVGCPEEGKSYTQAAVPGLLVILETDGKRYRYHGKAGSPLFHCPDSRARAPAYGAGEEVM